MVAPELAARKAAGRSLHDLELRDRSLSEPAHLCEPLAGGRNHLRKRAELGQQGFRERLAVAAGYGSEEHELEQLIVGNRARAGFQEALAQPHAMSGVVWRLGRAFTLGGWSGARARIGPRVSQWELRTFPCPQHAGT